MKRSRRLAKRLVRVVVPVAAASQGAIIDPETHLELFRQQLKKATPAKRLAKR